jgi:hypothetical protein
MSLFDVYPSGTLNIGTTNATTINIGASTSTNNVRGTTLFSVQPKIISTILANTDNSYNIATTAWVQNTVNTILTSYASTITSLTAYALLSSANFTAVSRATYPLTSAPNNVGSIILCGYASCLDGVGTVIVPKSGYVFPNGIDGVVATVYAGNGTSTLTTNSFNNVTSTSFRATSSSASSTFSYICFGH